MEFIIVGFVVAVVVFFVMGAAASGSGRKQHRPRPQSRLYYSDSGRRVWWQ